MSRRVPLLGLLLLAACGTAETTDTPVANGLTVQPLQYRDDIVADRLQLQVTNGLSTELSLQSVQLVWSGMNSALTERTAMVGIGHRVDLPVALSTPNCQIDGTTIAAPPPVTDAHVVFTLADGTTENATVNDPKGTLAAIHAAGCERQMIGQQVALSFVDFSEQLTDGRQVTTALLRLERGAAQGQVVLVSSGNTIPFNLSVDSAADTPLLTLDADDIAAEVPVQFLEARCDAHAVAEAKQPFRFVIQVQLGDDAPRPYVVEPPAETHTQMLATAAAGCAVLGEDGSLDGG